MRGFKATNVYQRVLTEALYRDCPKAALAAIAVSALTQGGDFVDEADQRLVTEWDILHGNGIVPQPVPGKWRDKVNHEKGL